MFDLKKYQGNVYHFSVDFSAIDKSEKLYIHKYFMVEDNIKQCSNLLNNLSLRY